MTIDTLNLHPNVYYAKPGRDDCTDATAPYLNSRIFNSKPIKQFSNFISAKIKIQSPKPQNQGAVTHAPVTLALARNRESVLK
jgi:hypothetical protein